MSGLYKLYRNKAYPPANPTASFKGSSIIVTGSNVGLGFEAACKFAQLGASRVILGVRNADKGAKAKAAIEERLLNGTSSSSSSSCRVDVWELDMNSYTSVKAFAARAETELARLDVALLNAGVWMMKYETSPAGWEETLQVNVLSTALLALLLLPKLRATKKSTGVTPTLEIVSSGLHEVATLSDEEKTKAGESLIEYFSKPEAFNKMRQYGITKLLIMCGLGALKDLVSAPSEKDTPEVFCTSVCPGMCKSDLGRGAEGLAMYIGKAVISLAQRSTEEGSRTLVSGTQLGEKGHGRFWQHDTIKPSVPFHSKLSEDSN